MEKGRKDKKDTPTGCPFFAYTTQFDTMQRLSAERCVCYMAEQRENQPILLFVYYKPFLVSSSTISLYMSTISDIPSPTFFDKGLRRRSISSQWEIPLLPNPW